MARSQAWRTLSTARIAIGRANNEPCCRCHGRLGPIRYDLSGRYRLGPTSDHLNPLAHGGQELVPLDQLGVAHRTCNSRHGSAIGNSRQGLGPGSRGGNPANYKPRPKTRRTPTPNPQPAALACTALQISGPPCAGKSTRLTQLAAEGWTVHDSWTWHQTRGATTRTIDSTRAWRAWFNHLDHTLRTAPAGSRHAYDRGDPTPRHPGITVEIINPGQDECHARADRDNRPPETHQWIDEWFTKHGANNSHNDTGAPRFFRAEDPHPAPRLAQKKRVNPMGSVGNVAGSVVIPGDVAPEGPQMHEDGFPLPRIMPVLPPDVSFDLADEAIEWIDANVPGPPLLPHQRFETRLTLATIPRPSAPGGQALAHPMVVNRKARQQGKTFWARRYCAWRLLRAEVWLGQAQRVLNTHPDGRQAVRLMEPLARALGYGQGMLPGLTTQTFLAEWYPDSVPDEQAAAWFARAMTTNALTGNQGITCVYVDELQDAKDKQISESLSGSMSGARLVQPQRVFTGTGEKPGSELLRKLRSRIGRPRMGWIEWSAPAGSDPRDPRSWRWASPDWSQEREDFLADELETALGAERPEEALRDFAANYMLSDTALTVLTMIDADMWMQAGVKDLVLPRDRAMVGLALDVTDGSWPVVAAARLPGGGVGVRLVGVFDSMEAAVTAASAAAGRACTLLVPRHALRGQVTVPGVRQTQHATEEDAASALALAPTSMRAGALLHDRGDEALTEAVLAIPPKRVARVWDAGTLALVCAWWAAKPRPSSAAA